MINPKVWLVEYEQNPRHHENEIFNMEVNLQESDIAWIGFKVNDEVAIEY